MILKKPLVSVLMITYGHEKYIKQAIEGVLMQKCNFIIELIVANDCSPDNTCEVIKEIIRDHPRSSWIKYTRHGQNKGVQPNFIWAASQAKGKYIALCEGDDYWTDPLKLQKQVDFLEINQEYSITFTDYEILNQNTKTIVSAELLSKFKSKSVFLLKDIIITNFIPTLTVLYRNNGVRFPDNGDKLFPGDWPLHILNASKGKIKFLPFTSAVYRKHDNGVCSSSNSIDNYKRYLATLKIVKKWFKNDLAIQRYFIVAQARIYAGIIKNYFK